MGNPDLVASLIRTQALRLAPADEVFWYTSGTVGPYYINTHYWTFANREIVGRPMSKGESYRNWVSWRDKGFPPAFGIP